MGGGCTTHESWEIRTECWTENQLRDLGINGRLIKLILKEIMCEIMNWIHLAQVVILEYYDELLDSLSA